LLIIQLPDILFSVNYYQDIIFHLHEVLTGYADAGLFYSKVPKLELTGYADAGYLSNPHNACYM
jgi:hypothetical protein